MFQRIELRKTRDFTTKINVTFDFIRQNFKILAKSLVYISGPLTIVGGFFMGMYQQKILSLGGQPRGMLLDFISDVFTWVGLAMIFLVLAYVASIIVVNEFVRLYETKEDPSNIQVGEIWEGVKTNFFKIFGAGIVVIMLTIVGVILLIIPGIYVSVTLSLLAPILIIEGQSIGDGIRRAFFLITEKWWSTFGLLMVTSIIVGFMGYVFQIPQVVFTFLIAFHKTSDGMAEPVLWEQAGLILSSVLAVVGSNLLQSIVFVALIFQYYNLVERKEAKGLMDKLESFGKTDANAPKNDETY